MKLFIIRHGESETNLKGHYTGWYNAPLTKRGIKDAEYAGEMLKGHSFDKVYTSDLDRAIMTMKTALPGYDYEKSALLREINVGTLENKPFASVAPEEKEDLRQNGYGRFQGESREDLRNRIVEFRSIVEKLPYENIAVFSHGVWLVGFLEEVLESKAKRSNIMVRNCCMGIFEYTNGRWLLHSWINK